MDRVLTLCMAAGLLLVQTLAANTLQLQSNTTADVTPNHSVIIGGDTASNARVELRTASGTPYIDFADDETNNYDARIILLPGALDIYGPGGTVRIFNHLLVPGTLTVGGGVAGDPLTVTGVVHSTAGGFRFPDGTLQTTAGVGVPATHGSRHLPGGADPIGEATSGSAGFMSAADKTKLDGATSSLVANAIVSRDSSGGFSASKLILPATSATQGWIELGGIRYFHQGTTPDFNSLYLGRSAGNLTSTGVINTGVGSGTLFDLTSGSNNATFGTFAGRHLTTGGLNVAVGDSALFSATADSNNVAVGRGALISLDGGNNNIAVGFNAGTDLITGSNNIYIGNAGVNPESSTIRIGSLGSHSSTYINGISGQTAASGVAVLINTSGKLGTTTSSRRFKRDIAGVEKAGMLLARLHPVKFRYREEIDATATPQYGLIAEEVAAVEPDLVLFDEAGSAETVRYHFLTPLLVANAQEQQKLIDQQREEIRDLRERLERLEKLLARPIGR